jgi:hypothetical protein
LFGRDPSERVDARALSGEQSARARSETAITAGLLSFLSTVIA